MFEGSRQLAELEDMLKAKGYSQQQILDIFNGSVNMPLTKEELENEKIAREFVKCLARGARRTIDEEIIRALIIKGEVRA